jgi:hypothetical protein
LVCRSSVLLTVPVFSKNWFDLAWIETCFPCWITDYKIHAMYISVCNIWFLNKLDSLHLFPRFECLEDLSFISKKFVWMYGVFGLISN